MTYARHSGRLSESVADTGKDVIVTEGDSEERPGTRERILRVALDEFAAKGVSGARVNDIADRAEVNIRMIYHYFDSKQGLFRAVTQEVFRLRRQRMAERIARDGIEASPEAFLMSFFDDYTADDRWVRLLEWESLEAGASGDGRELADAERRVNAVDERVAMLAEFQRDGLIHPDIDLRMLYVAMVSLTMIAVAFPPTVQFATGFHPGSDEFRSRYREFLRRVAPGIFRPLDG